MHVRSNPKGYGTYIILEGPSGQTLYAHLDSKNVFIGDGKPATQGQLIAFSDSGGDATGPHLHFEYAPMGDILNKINPNKVDPALCLTGAQFTVSPGTLSFQIPAGGANPPSQTVTLKNIGSRAISPVVTANPVASWLTVTGAAEAKVGGTSQLTFTLNAALVPSAGGTATVKVADAKDPTIFQTLQVQVTPPPEVILDPTKWQIASQYTPSPGEFWYSNSFSPSNTLFRITNSVASTTTFVSAGISFVFSPSNDNGTSMFQVAAPGTMSVSLSLASPLTNFQCAMYIGGAWTDYTTITSLTITLNVPGPFGGSSWPTLQCKNWSTTESTTVLISSISYTSSGSGFDFLVTPPIPNKPNVAPGTVERIK